MTHKSSTESNLYDPIAESALIGSILLDPANLDVIKENGVTPEIMLPTYGELLNTVMALTERHVAVDLVTLSMELTDRKSLERCGGAGYIASLTDGIAGTLSEVRECCRSIKAKFALRQLMKTAQNIMDSQGDRSPSVAQIIESARTELEAIQVDSVPGERLLIPAREFVAAASPEISWLVRGVIESGANGFIGGAPKCGKSWLAADLAIALATGSKWLGFEVDHPVRVALISREDTPSLTAWRLRGLCHGRGETQDALGNLWVNSKSQSSYFRVDDPALLGEMIQAIKKHHAAVVILDVLNVTHGADENDATEMRKVMNCLHRISAETGAGLCVLHHFNKAGEGTLTQRLRGSSAIAGWAEYVIAVERKGQGPRRVSFELKASNSPDSLDVTIESEGTIVFLRYEPARDVYDPKVKRLAM